MANVVSITFAGDDRSLSRTLGKLDKSADRTGGALGKLGMIAKGGALAGIAALGVAAKIGWDEMLQGQKVAAQTGAVLKSTGGIANVTAGDIDKLGTSLMNKSGTDDEAIKSGANLLLTFKNIRNEVGAGNQIFDQATTAALDLSVAFGKDMPSASVLMGKALDNPIAGITALQKVGVTFNQGQKDQIKAFMEAGNVMGAQKIILAELNSQVGGSAAAFGKTLPGQINIAKESFSNLAGQLMTGLLPAINAILAAALKVLDVFANIGRSFEAIDTSVSLTSTPRGSTGNITPTFKPSKAALKPRAPVKPVRGNTVTLPGFHDGGVVPGPRGQEVLALLKAGERVTPAGKGGGNTYNLTVQVLGDPRAAGDAVIRAIDAFERSNGRRFARA